MYNITRDVTLSPQNENWKQKIKKNFLNIKQSKNQVIN